MTLAGVDVGNGSAGQFDQRVQELNAEATARKIAVIDADPGTCQALLGEISSGKADLQTFVESKL